MHPCCQPRVVGDPEAIGASFRGISTYKSPSHQEIKH